MTDTDLIIPLASETLAVNVRSSTTKVRVNVVTHTTGETVSATLSHTDVIVDRVPIGREVSEPPAVRHEGDVTIVPVLEEVLVVTRQLVLREELHIRSVTRMQEIHETVPVRRQDITIERSPATS